MSRPVKCVYCGEVIYRDIDSFVQDSKSKRYSHKKCYEEHCNDRKILDDYINFLYKTKTVEVKTALMINSFIKKYKFSYAGMLGTLRYMVEIKNMKQKILTDGIGLLPYYYEEASNYYKTVKKRNNKNTNKNVNNKIIEVTILNPQREENIPKHFQFLEDEVNDI